MPPIFFNVKQARDFLLSHGLVYTLRRRRRRDREVTRAVYGSLYNHAVLGKVEILWIMTIEDPTSLYPFLPYSGFQTIEEWLAHASKDAHELYRVDLIETPR